jgi:hypothetical protein
MTVKVLKVEADGEAPHYIELTTEEAVVNEIVKLVQAADDAHSTSPDKTSNDPHE